jgi:hypothetical protein
MDANVGFSYGDHACDSLGCELVKGLPYNCGTCGLGSIYECFLDEFHIIQQVWPTLLELQDQV